MRLKTAATILICAVLLASGCSGNIVESPTAAPAAETHTTALTTVPETVAATAAATEASLPEYHVPSEIDVQVGAKTARLALRMPEAALRDELARVGYKFNLSHDMHLYGSGYSFSLSRLRTESGEYYLGLSGFQSHAATSEGLQPGDSADRIAELYGECEGISRDSYEQITYYRYDYDGYYLVIAASERESDEERVIYWSVHVNMRSTEWADAQCDEAAGVIEIDFGDERALRYAFGMKQQSLVAALEDLCFEYDLQTDSGLATIVEYEGICADFTNEAGGLDGLWIRNSAVTLSSGLHVGVSAEQILAVYGEMEREYVVDGGYRFTVQAGEYELVFMVDETAQTVSSIWLTSAE